MPKTFLMAGRNRKPIEVLYQNEEKEKEEDSNDERNDSPKRFRYDADSPHSSSSQPSPPHFSPSEASAFSKIGKPESESPPPKDHGIPKNFYHPGLFPTSLFPYTFPTIRPDTKPGSLNKNVMEHNLYPPLSVPGNHGDKSPTASPEKNMYYYVDPRIPFTNYFLNLTRLLNSTSSASKSCATATPLAKVADESRDDERDDSMSPGSQKASPGNYSASDTSAEHSDFSPVAKDFRVSDIKPLEKLHIPAYPDPQAPNPYASLLHTATHPHFLPYHSGGLLHPAMLQMSGGSLRRFNPDKPPPVKKYKCDVCGKAFSRSNTLVTHKRIHTGDKPFKCEICSRAFRQPGNLTRHRLTHTTVKPYVCPTCHKAFNRASNLHTHMRTHTSFKAYCCPYCGKGFHQKIDMKIHCYTHTGRPETAQI